jgi:hypothetical chaperone protein
MTLAPTTRPGSHPDTLGLDFGTTNTVGARLGAAGRVETLWFGEGEGAEGVYRSALNFWTEGRKERLEHFHAGGPKAIARYIASPEGCRFLQSFKTFAASPSFRSTNIHGRSFRFEDLMSTFLARMAEDRRNAGAPLPKRLVAGRPVTYAGNAPDPVLAEERYDEAFARVGFDEVLYVQEPVAAAYYFAQRLTRDATVLVADFGGGTSDFSIVHFAVGEGNGQGLVAHPLAQSGIGLAGDRFDYRIIDNVVAPKLGKGSSYRSFGKTLAVPGHYYTNFARWNQLAIMKSPEVLRELRTLARDAVDPDLLELFIEVIEEDIGFPLYAAVNGVKRMLSDAEAAPLRFSNGGLVLDETVTRADFETWIADDMEKILASLDEALAAARLTETGIDRVFLTGGTSSVPALRRAFESRFGSDKVETGDRFLSIAYGLALIGAEDDPSRWTVREKSDKAA